jgi:hypothetical protein
MTDPYDLENLRLSPELEVRRVTPRKLQKRREQFVMVPFSWLDRLKGASGRTYRLALLLLHLSWRTKGGPVKLANGMLKLDGVSRYSKWRALTELERRGLITVERRFRKSPQIRLNA